MRSETSASQGVPTAAAPSRSFNETARRRQLIAAAAATVDEVGYHRSSLAEIGKRAGIVKSAIGYHFSSKEALLLELVEESFTALGGSVLATVSEHERATARQRAYPALARRHREATP